VLLIEHDMDIALDLADTVTLLQFGAVIVDELADRIVILSAGSCVFAGDVTEVRSRPELIETHLGVATRKPGQ
jgi:ABC-type branched-subunit amino acid transport system ATPase component